MKPILQHQPTEATLYSYFFYVIVVITLQLYALNGRFPHNLYQHGVLSMSILDVLRARIIENFPEIEPDELELRINYAYELIKRIRK